MTPIGGTICIGDAAFPTPDGKIHLRWEAVPVPLRECEGGGWYTKGNARTAWILRARAVHKGWFGWALEDSTWKDEPLEDLLKAAILDAYRRYCRPEDGNKVCQCRRGYVSRYDGKCGHCRTTKEQKAHLWNLRRSK